MDALSEVLRAARLSGGVFLRGAFSEPWRLSSALDVTNCRQYLGVAADHLVLYHYVTEGEMMVDVGGGSVSVFRPGEAAILPRNDFHVLSGKEPAEAVSALDVSRIPQPGDLMRIDYGGGGTPTRIICGFLGGVALAEDPLLSALPPLMRFDSTTARSGDLVRTSLAFAADEIESGRPGAGAMLARISEMLFTEAVCCHMAELSDGATGWLAAARDRGVGRALAALHAHSERAWTVDDLACEAGLSRTVLGERFGRFLGVPPMEYLTNWRLQLAARQLATSDAPVLAVAEAVGYGSEAAFSRAFKRQHDLSPTAWRRMRGQGASCT